MKLYYSYLPEWEDSTLDGDMAAGRKGGLRVCTYPPANRSSGDAKWPQETISRQTAVNLFGEQRVSSLESPLIMTTPIEA